MTIIAYRDGIMAADSRAYTGDPDPIGVKQKIRWHDGELLGASSRAVGIPGAVMIGTRTVCGMDQPV